MHHHRHMNFFFFLLTLLALSFNSCKATSFGLYHLSARQAWSNCSVVRLPWNLCTACKLKPFTGTGPNLDFGGVNRFDIYNISDPKCMKVMSRYVEYNPCDERRAGALQNINAPWGYKVMAYFLYSSCELCCDCIPIGAREDEFVERQTNGTLLNMYRGNCAAHYFYDTCKVWPHARQITHLNGPEFGYSKNEKSEWCGDFKTWQFSNFSKNWIRNNNVEGMTWKMKRAMNQTMRPVY